MPVMDISNPYIIKFLTESYDKTARLRMRWNNFHKEKLNIAATLQREETGYNELDVLKATMEAGMLTTTRDNKNNARNRRLKPVRDLSTVKGVAQLKKGHSIVDIGLGNPKIDPKLQRPDTDLSIDPVMRPVDPKQKKILFKSKPDFGRGLYLKKRYAASPEDRYYFAETAGWYCGWRVKDSFFSKQKSEYGRMYSLDREQSRSGPHPDPLYYSNPGYKAGICILE